MKKKYIEANEFLWDLREQAITDEDRRFCDKVEYAINHSNESDIMQRISDMLNAIMNCVKSYKTNNTMKLNMIYRLVVDYQKYIEKNDDIF